MVKPSVTTEERNDFLLEDLRVSVDEVSEIWPEPESQLLRLALLGEPGGQLTDVELVPVCS